MLLEDALDLLTFAVSATAKDPVLPADRWVVELENDAAQAAMSAFW